MSLKFKFIPLTFLKDEEEIKKQIKNTIILRYLFEQNNSTTTLAKVIEGTQYGYNASALVAGKNKFLRISDITDGKVNWQTVPFCDCDDESTYLLYPNDILIARTGGTTGKSFLITNPPLHSIFAGYLIRIRANAKTSPQFLNVFLNSYVYWSQIVSINEGEFRPSANAATLSSLILPDCKLEKQLDAVAISNGEIVDGYSDLFKLINKTLDEYEKTKNIIIETQNQESSIAILRQSIIKETIQGKHTTDWRKQNPSTESASLLLKRIKAEKENLIKENKLKKEKELTSIQKEEIPYKIPQNWVWCKLSDLIYYRKGKKPKSLVSKKDKEYNIPYIDIAAFEKGIISNYTNDNKVVFCTKNNILLVWDGARIGLVGKNVEGAVGSTLAKIDVVLINVEFIYLIFQLNFTFFNKNQKQAGLPHMNGELIDNLLVALPPLEEQNVIVEKAELLMSKCNALQKELKNSRNYANQLMQAVLKEAFETKTEVCQD
jgi:type I restriction enzyme S subunit